MDVVVEPAERHSVTAAPPRTRRPWRVLAVHLVGWALLGGFLTSAVAMVLLGSLEARPGALEERLGSDAAAGEVTTLHVERPFRDHATYPSAPGAGHWSGVVEVRWREGGLWRSTSYVTASSDRAARRLQRSTGLLPSAVGDPYALPPEWTQAQPRLDVAWSEPGSRAMTGSAEVFDVEWTGPSWAVLTGGVIGLTALAWLLVGPQPWRFTRWGWFWLVFGAWPVGVPAFLLFGGSTGLLPPSDPARRLSGWSGFGLSIVTALLCGALLA